MQFILRFSQYLQEINLISIIFRITLASLVGGIIGSERSRNGHAAGLRTYTLVAVGSAMTTLVGVYSVAVLGNTGDPMRIGAQVISGIGFLGAGQILTRNKVQITGLTTAAGLWVTASIGLAVGIGFYWGAVIGLLAVKLTISLFPRLEGALRINQPLNYYLEVSGSDKIRDFLAFAEEAAIDYEAVTAKSGRSDCMGFHISINGSPVGMQTVAALRAMPYVGFLVSEG